MRTLLPLWLLGCAGAPDLEAPAVDLLSAQQRAVRISVALRGVPPSASESALVQANPAMLPVLVDAWLDDERFGETVKDLYAEALDIRADTRPIVPAIGELEDVSEAAIFRSVSEAPLRLIADVVMSDRPLTDIFSEPQVYADELLVRIYGLQGWDPDGEEVQRLDWVDGRPEAGILASSALWMRHESNGSNYHRGRANLVSTVFACDDIGSRDIVIPGEVDLSDDEVVANEVQANPACAACHDELDPLAAYFSGFKRSQHRIGVFMAYEAGCGSIVNGIDTTDWCYPLQMYDTENAEEWVGHLRAPAYQGQPGEGLVALGQQLAEDPRFAECTARRFASYLFQRELAQVSAEDVVPFTQTLTDSGFDTKRLVREIVLSEQFGAARVHIPEQAPLATGVLTMRPEAYARWLEEVAGFTWWAVGGCDDGCWPVVDLGRSDLYGFRSMAGGTDGFYVTSPTHTATPTRVLVLNRMAGEAAGFVVTEDLALTERQERRVLVEVDGTEAGVDRQIRSLWWRVFGEEPEAVDRQAVRALYDGVDGDAAERWKVVLTALFQDPQVVFY